MYSRIFFVLENHEICESHENMRFYSKKGRTYGQENMCIEMKYDIW